MTSGALTRYRVMAYTTAVMLLVLTLVAMPLKYAAGETRLVEIVAPIHGFLYIGYLLTVLELTVRGRWRLGRAFLIALAGTIPFAGFFAERKVAREERAAVPEAG
ncbi:MAG: DUF3817 domain-containing protein [Carbonactinosporaceae bacterium]